MEQIQLLEVEESEEDDVEQTSARICNGHSRSSLESLTFDFEQSRPTVRSHHRQKSRSVSKVRALLIGTTFCCGIVAIGYLIHRSISHDVAPPMSSTWVESLDVMPDFSRCPKDYADQPVLLVLSLDGFAASFVNRTKHIVLIAEKGVRAVHMRPVFPSNTFPNHYSIVTGLYPESHGIIDNTFMDENRTESFMVWNESKFNPKWWKGRPIWQVAQEQGLRVFAQYWPGSEVLINNVRPTRYVNFTLNETVENRVSSIMGFLHLPKDQRPHLILNYYHMPDTAVHLSGFNSTDLQNGIFSADKLVEMVMEGIHASKLFDCVNIIILSDHGVSNCAKAIFPTEKLINRFGEQSKKIVVSGGSVVQNRLDPSMAGLSVAETVAVVACSIEDSPYQVYSSETDELPIRLHYRNSPRISPIILLANISVGMYAPQSNDTCKTHRAVHGWDTIYSDMQATFIAFGPSFKTKTVIEPFANVELFGLFADLLNIKPGENNGTEGSLRHLIRNEIDYSVRDDAYKQYDKPLPKYESVLDFHSVCSTDEKINTKCSEKFSKPFIPNLQEDISKFEFLHFGQHGPPNIGSHARVRLLINRHYATGFSDSRGVPLWTSFAVGKQTGETRMTAMWDFNSSCYVKDPRVLNRNITDCPDFQTFSDEVIPVPVYPYDVGDLHVHDGSLRLSTNFLFMHKSFRDGIWALFWNRVLSWTEFSVDGRIQATVGPVYDEKFPFGIEDVPESSSLVPTHFFVILTRKTLAPICTEISCDIDVVSFVFSNQPRNSKTICQREQFWFLTRTATVRDIEILTGMKFFTSLPLNEAARIKTRLTDKLWDMDRML